MLSRHCAEIHRVRVLTLHSLSISLIISEAILDTDDNPKEVRIATAPLHPAHHKLVKTTPKPRATKKSSGELGPLPPLSPVAVGLEPEDVGEEDKTELVEVAILKVSKGVRCLISAAYAEMFDSRLSRMFGHKSAQGRYPVLQADGCRRQNEGNML